jgi:asparagine synthase (glutamine-hydrolysing)
VHQEGFKVVLTGEGADEMFGGYDIFKEAKIRRFWGRFPESRWRPHLLKRLYPYMDALQRQTPAYLGQFFHVTAAGLNDPFFSHLPRWELTARLKRFFSSEVAACLEPGAAIGAVRESLPAEFGALAPFHQAEYLEATQLLSGYILSSQGDRMAMAHSVEGRYPLLDHRVVEFAAKLPVRLKMKVLREKYLLNQAAAGLVPEPIRARAKQPYRAPGAAAVFTAAGSPLLAYLSPDTIRKQGIFDARAVAGLAGKCRGGGPLSVKDDMALAGIVSTGILVERFGGLDRSRASVPDFAMS